MWSVPVAVAVCALFLKLIFSPGRPWWRPAAVLCYIELTLAAVAPQSFECLSVAKTAMVFTFLGVLLEGIHKHSSSIWKSTTGRGRRRRDSKPRVAQCRAPLRPIAVSLGALGDLPASKCMSEQSFHFHSNCHSFSSAATAPPTTAADFHFHFHFPFHVLLLNA